MSTSPEEEATISIPSLAFVAVLGYFIYRYFFSAPTELSSTSSTNPRGTTPGIRFTPAQVDQIAAMFPQLSRRDIMWDLHRNRGSVQSTTERVLMGGRLDAVSQDYTRHAWAWWRSAADKQLLAGASIISTASFFYDHASRFGSSHRNYITQIFASGPDHAIQSASQSQLERQGEGRGGSCTRLGEQQRRTPEDAPEAEGRNDSRGTKEAARKR